MPLVHLNKISRTVKTNLIKECMEFIKYPVTSTPTDKIVVPRFFFQAFCGHLPPGHVTPAPLMIRDRPPVPGDTVF
eukprot:10274905-Heterocapsa_arctica.AAC.1